MKFAKNTGDLHRDGFSPWKPRPAARRGFAEKQGIIL